MSKRGMTKRERKKLMKILLDHPYYDVCSPPLSDEEVAEIKAQHTVKSGKEFIDSIYASLGMERPKK